MDFDAIIYDLGLSDEEVTQMIDIWEGSVNNESICAVVYNEMDN